MQPIRLLLVAALCAGSLLAQSAPTADELFQKVTEARNARIPESVSKEDRMAWYAAQEDRASRLAEEFLLKFPNGPHRWEALGWVATLRRTFDGPQAATDQAAWTQRQTEARRQIIDSAEAPEEVVANVYLSELRPFLQETPASNDRDRAESLLSALAKRAPNAGVRVYAESSYLNGLLRRDATAAEAYAKTISTDPNPNVAKVGLQKMAAIDLRKHPIDLKRTAFDGREVDFKALRGKVVLVDFWATWCVPCMEQMPEIKRVYAKYRDQGLEVIGVTDDIPPRDPKNPRGVEKTPAQLSAFLEKEGMPWPQIWDMTSTIERRGPKELLVLFGVSSLPTTFLIDKDGRIFSTDNHGEKLEANVRKLLGLK
ncbi:MAG: TlpA disulfide reductase family protein [Opitutaceae bacterium]